MQVRAAAAQVIDQVMNGSSLSDCLPEQIKKISDVRDQRFLQALCYGVCRWYFRLDALANELLDKPLKEKDQDIYALILVGLYQLSEMRTSAHAAVSETVSATKNLKKIWAKGLVNAVLRNYQRREQELNEKINKTDAQYAHPEWIVKKLKTAWPQDWQDILTANNQHPPFALRVNQQKISREKYFAKLAGVEIIPETQAGIILETPVDVQQLPGFSVGEVSVQDGAAQLAAEILELAPGQYVLDACAAPGGKTAHILELQKNVDLVAIDEDGKRLQLVRDNLQRLQLSAKCIVADAGDPKAWWDGKLFDRILLDAPCSASGVIRRHPDIKLLRRTDDIPQLAKEQLRLLNALWELLKSGGLLVYATCSIFPEENAAVLQAFLSKHPDAKEEKLEINWGIPCEVGRQILPGMSEMDGFYYARLRKA